jgi:virginiamycin B lyase
MSFLVTNSGWGAQSVPYVIDSESFSSKQRKIVELAIRKWNEQAPTRLVHRTNQADYLFFRRHQTRCNSLVGRQGGRQEILCAVGDSEQQNEPKHEGNVMHEIGHAMGLLHEHKRPDREEFVDVRSSDPNLRMQDGHDVAAIGGYDLGSIMHYSPGPDLRVKVSTSKKVGQREKLTKGDIEGLRWLRRDWQREPGSLAQISVSRDKSNNDKTLWGVNAENQIFTKTLSNRSWTRVSGSLRNVAVGPSEVIWGVNGGDEIFRRNVNNEWTRMPGSLRWISVGHDLSVWGTNSRREIFRWFGTKWERISGSLAYVSVGTREHVWGVNERHEVFMWSGDSWRKVSGSLNWISVGLDGTVWGTNNRREIYLLDAANHWTRVSGLLARIDVSDFDTVYGVNEAHEVFSYRE